MKRFLISSLLLNAVLTIALAWAFRHRSPTPSQAIPDAPSSAPRASEVQTSGRIEAVPAISATEPTQAQSFDWRLVESEDYKKYIENLRSIGCPEETIRDIIVADVNKLFESRRRELNASTNRFQFWKTGNMFAEMMNPERLEKNQELAKEKRELLKELLGTAPDEKPELMAGVNPFESMLDYLSPAKQNQVMEIYTKYQAKLMKQFSGGTPDADDMKAMLKVQKEMEAELGSMLTPEELEDYQLRMSQTAMTMRFQLGSFDPNEEEFRKIFKLRKEFDDEYGLFGMNSADKAEREKRQKAEQEMKEQLKSVLGESRYADYDRAQDWNFQQIHRIAEKNSLSRDTAVKVYDMKRIAEAEASRVRSDQSLTREQRDAALLGIRNETEKSIQTVFGSKAWTSYSGQAHWLRSISPDKAE